MYIDTCHSGSAVDKAKDLVAKKGIVHENGDPYIVNYFTSQCELILEIFTSCRADELANDAGVGKGGLWTNTYMAKGDFG